MLTPRLVLAGAGDFAKEVLWMCSEIPPDHRKWGSICLIDDNPAEARLRMQEGHVDVHVIESIKDFSPCDRDLIVCTIADPHKKLSVCERLHARGGRFTNIIHPTVAIGPATTLGMGIIMARSSMLTVNIQIGNYVTINSFSSCGHDAVVEDGCTISAHCDITGHAHLERGAFLGSHAAVMPGVRVGAFATVAAGSVAFRNVKAGETVIGVPAKPIF
jgi:sugar O-acyltransferase (sialic acid O-acetyltransferase NeuD family)